MQDKQNVGVFFALAATALFSFKYVIAKSAYGYGVESQTLLAMRLYFAVPLLLGTLWLRERAQLRAIARTDLAQIAALGVLGVAVAMGASFASIQRIPASLSNVLTFTYPALTVLVMVILFGIAPNRAVLASLAITFVGILCIADLGHVDYASDFGQGVLLALFSAMAYAVYNAFAERLLSRISALQLSALGTAFALIALVAVFGLNFDARPVIVLHGLALGVVCGYLPFLAHAYALKYAGATRTVVINTLSPPLTLLWAVVFLGESMSPLQLVGMLCVVAGILLAKLGKPKKAAPLPVIIPQMAK